MDEKDEVKNEEPKIEPQPVSEPTPPATATPAPTPAPTPGGSMSAPTATPAGVNGPMPAELHGFNWGAFLLSWIWGIGNKSYLTLILFALPLLIFVPVFMLFAGFIALGLGIWFGIKGNEWAWHNRHFDSVEQFKKVQKAWTIAGIIVIVLAIILNVVFMVFLGGALLDGDNDSIITDEQSIVETFDPSVNNEVEPRTNP